MISSQNFGAEHNCCSVGLSRLPVPTVTMSSRQPSYHFCPGHAYALSGGSGSRECVWVRQPKVVELGVTLCHECGGKLVPCDVNGDATRAVPGIRHQPQRFATLPTSAVGMRFALADGTGTGTAIAQAGGPSDQLFNVRWEGAASVVDSINMRLIMSSATRGTLEGRPFTVLSGAGAQAV